MHGYISCFRILVDVTAYGRKVPTLTIQLCDIISGCPISGGYELEGKILLALIFAALG